ACIGPIALASAGIVSLSDKFTQYRAVIISAALLVSASLGALTWRQAATYADIGTLWRTTLAKNPECWIAHTNLGLVLFEQGKLDSAIQVCRSALLLRPLDADCHTTLAIALEEKGNPAEAIQHYQKALELAPGSIPTLTNLAWLLATSQNASLRNGPKAVDLA